MLGKKVLAIVLGISLLLLAGCSSKTETVSKPQSSGNGAATPTPTPVPTPTPTKLKMIGTLPLKSYGTTALENFKKNSEKNSNGSLIIETFPAGQLYNDKDAVNVIPTGSVDLGIVQLDMWTGKAPVLGALYIPTYFDSHEHFYNAREKMIDQLDKVLQEKAQVKLIGWFNYNDQTIISKKPIKTISDFKGQRLRGWGEYSAAFLQFAGATSVTMAVGEVYDALSKGVIDGAMSTPVSHRDRKFYEVAKNVTEMVLNPVTPYAILVNLNTWNKLSSEQQKVLLDAGKETDTWSRTELKKETSKAMEDLKNFGLNIHKVTPEDFNTIRSATIPKLKEKYLSQAGKDGEAIIKIIEDSRGK